MRRSPADSFVPAFHPALLPDDILGGACLTELQPVSAKTRLPLSGERVLVTTSAGAHIEAQRGPHGTWITKHGDVITDVVSWVSWPWEGGAA